MDTGTALSTATTLLTPWTKSTATPEPNRLDVTLTVSNLIPAVTALLEARWGYLAAITGLDRGAIPVRSAWTGNRSR